jgi:hypothetical protein
MPSRSRRRSRSVCKSRLSRKIGINIHEPRYKSRKQAIAVSYSQVLKKHPKCARSLRKSSRKSRSRR